jgi:predicted nucleotidyltransferase
MKEAIRQELLRLETEKKIRILYAVESGSRAWGFASSDSDWDVRFLYVHPQDWYLSIEDGKDNIEQMLPNDIDLAGWDLKKALRLFRKSNPPLLEWIGSPLIYHQATTMIDRLRSAAKLYFNPKSCLYHYLSMAHNNWTSYFKEDTARIKKYFYVLRPLLACDWIMERQEMAPMEFNILLRAAAPNVQVQVAIQGLLERKMGGEELSIGPRIGVIDDYIEAQFSRLNEVMKTYNFTNHPEQTLLNEIFRSTLIEAWA